ncbi:MAG: hydantoinase B/oxoprolinase family protein, partial [Zetaproteobacteria bacterium]
IARIPDGQYRFSDALEDDGFGNGPLPIQVAVTIQGDEVEVDFSGTTRESVGPVNCPLAVTAAAVYYVFRCLMPPHTPQTSAIFRPITVHAEQGSLVHASPHAAVAAGNVETSQRIVDVLLGALAQAIPERIPAAAQGTMNNVVFGDPAGNWVYYETLAGGMGGHARGPGLSAVQCHMTNTRNSSIEIVEMHYPLRIERYAIRQGSGGAGQQAGGEGLVREWRVLAPCHVSVLSERRASAPYGLEGGERGQAGRNLLWQQGKGWQPQAAKFTRALQAGDRLRVETPGGGGYGKASRCTS